MSTALPPRPTAEARVVFGPHLELAMQYAALLAGDAVIRGLIGPRETPRLWDRHLVNCAVVAELLPFGAHVVDVGSGAGLPGLALACVRPDLSVVLLDSLTRRTTFLDEAVTALGLRDRVEVRTGRVEEAAVVRAVGNASWVTARAVAPLERLARWCVPLLRPGGRLLAMKGVSAAQELDRDRPVLRRLGVRELELVECGVTIIDPPTTVVVVTR